MRRITLILMILSLSSCIRNDIPYPIIPATIEAIEVDGAKEVNIDKVKQRVNIVLEESTDISKVNIKSVSFGGKDVKASWDIRGSRDLNNPLKLTLSTYQDYIWEISATQPIERYFSVKGQLGNASIDAANHRVIFNIPSSANIANLQITQLKLGPERISQYSPAPESIHDFSETAQIELKYHNITELWHLYAEQSDVSVEMLGVDAWSRIAYFRGRGVSGDGCGFRYRIKGAEDWEEVSAQMGENGDFSASADALRPNTEYEVKAFCLSDETEAKAFVTEGERQLPNSGFEVWTHSESDKYYSFYDPESPEADLQKKWWCSGNNGSTTVGSSYAITIPDLGDKVEGRSSVKLASAYVVIKFAAGNIFSGEYYKTIGTTGGVIRLGRPFDLRPRKLKLNLKYKSGTISAKTFSGKPEGDPVKVGDKDRGVVWVALGDWDYRRFGGSPECPVEVNTTDKSSFFDRNSEGVIAYGEVIYHDSTDGWVEVEIPLQYKSTSRKPTHIIVSAAASMLGDYFTGSEDSVMWLDNLSLEY